MKFNFIKNHPEGQLFVTTLASFMTGFSVSSVNIALPQIGHDLRIDALMLGWITTSFLLSTAVFLIPMGKISDSYGRKNIFASGISIYIFSSLISALSFSGWMLILSRVIQGIGAGMIFSTSSAIVAAAFGPGGRGRALGINTASTYIGLSAGPFLGGIMTGAIGWRSIFVFSAATGIIIMPFIYSYIPGDKPRIKGGNFDYPGALLCAAGLSSLITGISMLQSAAGIALASIGLAFIAAFIIWESRNANPVLEIKLFSKNPNFLFSNLAAMINYSATHSISFFLSIYLQTVREMSPWSAGTVMVIQPVMQALFSPLAGKLSDSVEPRVLSSLGMFLTTMGLLFLSFCDTGTPLLLLAATLALLGFGFALFTSPNTNAIMSSVDKKYLGTASALVSSMRVTGQMLSMGAALLLFSVFIGKAAITPEQAGPIKENFLHAMTWGFRFFSALCLAGTMVSMARGNSRTVSG